MGKIWLYNVEEAPNVVHKNLGLLIAEINVDVVDPCTRKNPRLLLSSSNVDLGKGNYFYYDAFDRFYYMEDCITYNNGMVEISGVVDPLKSFEGAIGGLTCLVRRQEFIYNGDLVDDEIVPRIKRKITKKVVGSVGNTISYALTVTGGADE